jgi:hypothetical protein
MKTATTGKLKFGAWGIACGAIIAMIVGFAWGGWSTAGTTQKMSEEAVLASQAAICVAQFMKAPNHAETLVALEKINRWERADYIEKGGWDKMPGQEKADYGVARACYDGIELLIEK